ncbi:MAG: hypothetical protein AABX74_05210, partial [Nanoarchaeota archaeon]
MAIDPTTLKLATALGILVGGYIAAKVGSSLIIAVSKRKEMINASNILFLKIYRYIVIILAILGALAYIRADILKDLTILSGFITNTYNLLPSILLAILLLVLAIAVVNLITLGLKRVFDSTGITEFMLEQRKEHFLNGILIFVRALLYLFTALFLLDLSGINISGIKSAIGWFFYGFFALLFLYIFFGTKTLMENFIVGIYLKTSRSFKLGQKVKID